MNAETAERIVRLRLAVEVSSKFGAWSGPLPPCGTDSKSDPHSNEVRTGGPSLW